MYYTGNQRKCQAPVNIAYLLVAVMLGEIQMPIAPAASRAQAGAWPQDLQRRCESGLGVQMGEKQAADIAEASEQASLISTMSINADEATFVSSGLNPGTESYTQLENNSK